MTLYRVSYFQHSKFPGSKIPWTKGSILCESQNSKFQVKFDGFQCARLPGSRFRDSRAQGLQHSKVAGPAGFEGSKVAGLQESKVATFNGFKAPRFQGFGVTGFQPGLQKLLQQSSSQTSNSTTRHITQSKKQCLKKRCPHMQRFPKRCSSQRFQQQGSSEVPAKSQQGSIQIQGGSSKGPAVFWFSGSRILLAPLAAPEIETQQNRSGNKSNIYPSARLDTCHVEMSYGICVLAALGCSWLFLACFTRFLMGSFGRLARQGFLAATQHQMVPLLPGAAHLAPMIKQKSQRPERNSEWPRDIN